MRKQPTEEQKAAAAERRAKMRDLSKKVSAMCPEERRAIVDRLGCVLTIERRPLSMHNTLMILMQNPDASIVGGFRQWKRAGRSVKKGEHGAAIWIPTGRTSEAAEHEDEAPDHDDEGRKRFVLGTVFDVAQTAAADDSTDETSAEYTEHYAACAAAAPSRLVA